MISDNRRSKQGNSDIGQEKTILFQMPTDYLESHGIHQGDILIFAKSQEPVDGDIVIALIDDMLIVRKFYREGTCIRFIADSTFKPILMPSDRVQTLGVMTTLERRLEVVSQ